MPTGSLPSSGKKLFEEVYNKALKGSCKGDKECAARTAWSAVKGAGWKKDKEGKWHKSADLHEFSLTIKKASIDPQTGDKCWRADTSNTDNDKAGDNMTLDLFRSFVKRIANGDLAPEEYQSEFWKGGMPYISVSHYPDLDGKAVPGSVDATYIDGKYLKAKGRFSDTKLGNACWKAITDDLEKIKRGESIEDKVRVSIAFLDFAHQHKSNGYIFQRNELDDICPECLKELIKGEYAGKSFLDGLLVHYALTRVPMNVDTDISPDTEVMRSMTTRKEDAASIIGEDLASELDEEAKLVGKSEALIIKAEDEPELVEEAKTKKDEKEKPEDEEDMEDDEEEKDKKKKMKSEVVDFKVDLSEVFAKIEELKSLIPAQSEKSVHVLDGAIETLKARYDEIATSDFPSDEKLRMVQQPFNELGQAIISTLKPEPVITESKVESGNPMDLVKAFSEALQPLAQKLDLLIAQNRPVQNPVNVPPRRSFDPNLVQQAQLVSAGKPLSIDEISRRSVGLPG